MLLNDLGQTVLPNVFTALSASGIVETADIFETTDTVDAGGAIVKGVESYAYESVPVAVKPKSQSNNADRRTHGDRQISRAQYELIFPRYWQGSRIDFDIANSVIRIQERGDEPEKRYRAIGSVDKSGVVFSVIAEREG